MGEKFAFIFMHVLPMIMRITPPGCDKPPRWFSRFEKRDGKDRKMNYQEVKKQVLLIESEKMESQMLLSSAPSTKRSR